MSRTSGIGVRATPGMGSYPKRVKTEIGEVDLRVPRDRDGSFTSHRPSTSRCSGRRTGRRLACAAGATDSEPYSHYAEGTRCAGWLAVCARVLVAAPAQRTRTLEAAYRQVGAFSYGAVTRRNAVYPGGRVASGEPVFAQLVRRVAIAYRYRLATALPHRQAGTLALTATLANDRGWARTFTLAQARPFAGDAATVRGVLDLAPMTLAMARFERLTGVSGSAFTLTIEPRLTLQGLLDRRPVPTGFHSRLPFTIDGHGLRLAAANPAVTTPAPLVLARVGSTTTTVTNEWELGPFATTPDALRRISLMLVALALLATLATLLALRRLLRADHHTRQRFFHRSRLIELADAPSTDRQAISVGALADLIQLADRHDSPILTHTSRAATCYLVDLPSGRYAHTHPIDLDPQAAAPTEPMPVLEGEVVADSPPVCIVRSTA